MIDPIFQYYIKRAIKLSIQGLDFLYTKMGYLLLQGMCLGKRKSMENLFLMNCSELFSFIMENPLYTK